VLAVFWFYTALAPGSLLTLGAAGRLFYLPGVSLAVLVATAAMRLVDLASARLSKASLRPPLWAAPYLASLAVAAPAVLLIGGHGMSSQAFLDSIGEQAAANRAFVDELRTAIPTVPSGGVLYVTSAPFNLIIFNDDALDNLVELYYGEVEVKSVPMKEPPFWNVGQVRSALRPQDRFFVFQGGT
jgi:hypothetical protein